MGKNRGANAGFLLSLQGKSQSSLLCSQFPLSAVPRVPVPDSISDGYLRGFLLQHAQDILAAVGNGPNKNCKLGISLLEKNETSEPVPPRPTYYILQQLPLHREHRL